MKGMLSESYKNRMMQLAGLLKESVDSALVIPAGKHLFHGTVEEYDIKNARPGGYDGIFWTSEDPAISQTYIPVAGSSMLSRSEHLAKPSLITSPPFLTVR